MSEQQPAFEFTKEIPAPVVTKKETNAKVVMISLTDMKAHFMELFKLYCVGTCTLESCLNCPAEKMRLFIARIAPCDLYEAPLPSNIPLVDAGGEASGEDLLLLNDLELTTERLGIRSVFTLDECLRFSAMPVDVVVTIPKHE